MPVFTNLYKHAIELAKHPYAICYLALASFVEAFFIFCPPDVMLLPMTLAKPERGYFYGLVTGLSSFLGGVVGYAMGYYFINLIYPYLIDWGYGPWYLQIRDWFHVWGVWVLFGAALCPAVPYKLFTVSSGAIHMAFAPFLLVTLMGRCLRFTIEVAFMRMAGRRIEAWLLRYGDRLGWCTVGILGTVLSSWYFLG